ncbi:hypothetical protein PVL29_011031 [Vitis rotundifolia]|uniref:Uncharacterized protein n=1 Tax=Vitis rotundifolia TaxID=103349 RepID=A0AA38ZWW5_VITRO|nr:hypothetical protein PVL29_011031 [Vitis rotundifolia]
MLVVCMTWWGSQQGNCFLIIIVISMGNRYDCLLVSPRLTVRVSSFLSYVSFILNMNYFSSIKIGLFLPFSFFFFWCLC